MVDKKIPTTVRLAQALRLAGAPGEMITRAEEGYYDDYKSPLAAPIYQLVLDCQAIGTSKMHNIAQMAISGEFDGQQWEADEWAKSEEGKATLGELGL